ncbi:MAG: aldehyde ferredoxin oxidoreductase [Firmicutes bacterium]|nr:aldehyde ferredoxin oxidoreductase [Bacillota bacterium]
MFGYWGKLLRVNLTNQTYKVEEIPEVTLKKFLGGAALGAKVLLEETAPNVEPLSPENKVIFAVGPLQAVSFPGNGKWSVITKGPLTGTYLDSAGTGHWAPYLKKAGYDLLVIEGKAEKPVYLYINDDVVEIKDATQLWGQDTVSTSQMIKEELGDRRINALNIGPAGENLSPVACITCDGHSFAGRGGAGAVMGSKNLKAVAVWGTKQVPVHDKEKASEISKKLFKSAYENGKYFREHGTACAIVPLNELGDVPVKYWRDDVWTEGSAKIGAPRYTEYLKAKPKPCINCPLGCHRHVHFEYDGEKKEANGPEYETLGMMGASLLVEDLDAICMANDLCNKNGVDTVSTGAFIGFLMECYELGWLTKEQIGDLELKWGDGDVLVELTRQIINMEGLGKLFKNGIRGAAAEIGHEAEKIIVEVKGLDYPAHDPRATFGVAVNYATSPRGACHERGNVHAGSLGLYYPELQDAPADRFSVDQAAQAAYLHQSISTFYNTLTFCKFMIGDGGITLSELCEGLEAITGWKLEAKDLFRVGEAAFTLQRLINVRDGLDRKDDSLPEKMKMAALVGPRAGEAPTPHEKILDDYYKLRGWNEKGVPTAEKLKELELEEYVSFIPAK